MNDQRIVIQPTGGLANKLRVLFSFVRKQSNLVVVWPVEESCPGLFLDVFTPLKNVQFVVSIDSVPDYRGCSPSMIPNYSQLHLAPKLQEELHRRLREMGDRGYVAGHIRRTDHSELAKSKNKFTSDETFREFLDSTDLPIFIATDNGETQQYFKTLYENRLIIFHEIPQELRSLRATSLEEAVLDLFLCVNATEFLGSGWSSFTDLIKVLRETKSDAIRD